MSDRGGEQASLLGDVSNVTDVDHVKAAQRRMVGIVRAYGGLMETLEADKKRLLRLARELADTVALANERNQRLATLQAEADALHHRFGLPRLGLPGFVPAGVDARTRDLHRDLDGYIRTIPAMEHCGYEMRQRRTYEEISDTPAFEIIRAAGLSPWPPLTEQQLRLLAAREKERRLL